MNIYGKLAAVQQKVRAPKDKKNQHLKINYRSAEGILEAVKPILAENGATILLEDEMIELGGRIYVKSTASFVTTESGAEFVVKVSAYAREAESKPGLDVAQVTGSASSYARKYALNGLLLLDDAKQDPDAEENTRRTEQAEKEVARKAPDVPVVLYASEEQLKTIRELAEKAGVDLTSIGEDVEKMTSKRADAMIARLRERIGERNDAEM